MPLKTYSRWLQGVLYTVAGVNHFVNPEIYLQMMPSYLPWPNALQLTAGALEVIGGLGLLVPRLEKKAAWLLIIVLVGVFPANLELALNGGAPLDVSPTMAWLRLPFQLLFIKWAYWHTRTETKS